MKNNANRKRRKEGKPQFPRTPRLGVLMGERNNPFWSELKHHLESGAAKMGFEIQFFWPSLTASPGGQLRVFWQILALDFDLIIINPLNRDNLAPGIDQACRQGIPVLDVGAKTDPEILSQANSCYFPVRTVDFYQQGGMGAKHIIKRIKSFETERIVILEGRKEAAQSRGRSQGAADAFAKEKSIQRIIREAADFDRKKARRAATRILSVDPEVGAFFCANDLMALGVAEAIRRLKWPKEILVVGVDLIQEAREAIRAGLMEASVAFSTASVAKAVLESALKVLKGKAVAKAYLVKSSLVHRKNLDSWEKRNPAA